VDLPTALPPDTLVARINDELPHDINVLTAERVPPRFHARHSAVARRYRYQISRRRSAFEKPYVWWVREPLDLSRMRAAADTLVGFADFRSFTDDDPEEKSTVVLLQELTLTEQDHLIPGAHHRLALFVEDGPTDSGVLSKLERRLSPRRWLRLRGIATVACLTAPAADYSSRRSRINEPMSQ
jgi:hypothetical protein